MTNTPGPRPLSDAEASELLRRHQFGTLATNKRSGHPHLTTMLYRWDPRERVVRFATTADRLKAKHLRRDPRAALHVPGEDVSTFAVAEGEASISEVTTSAGDAIGREVLAIVPAPATPEGERELLAQFVAERRLVVRLAVTRLYGTALEG